MPGRIVRRLPSSGTTVRRLLIVAMILAFLSLIGAGIAAVWATLQNQAHTRDVSHTYQVEQAIASYRIAIEEAETARRGYLIDPDPTFMTNYRIAAARLPGALDRIAALTPDNPRQSARVARLRRINAALARRRARTNALIAGGQRAAAEQLFRDDASVTMMRGARAIGNAMIREERGLLSVRDAAQRASVRLFFIVLGIAGVLLVLVIVITLVTVLRYTRDLRASRDTLRELADTLEDAVKERTADLTRANEEIQRFAYIVSHDLRSPLVNVMGFTAELDAATWALRELIDRAEERSPDIVTEEARFAAREDLPEAIGFIRTSTQKMDALINAILKLSREGRRVIAPEPIDMDELADNISDTIQHRLEEAGAELDIEHPLPEIISDRLAVDQILSNLVDNAIKYLDPARPGRISVRGWPEAGRVLIEVEDNGRGIDPRDHDRVFDLFRRSGTQDKPGEGIGLAHVRALAYRLGGIITLSSELGKGATFRLSLPKRFVPAEKDTP